MLDDVPHGTSHVDPPRHTLSSFEDITRRLSEILNDRAGHIFMPDCLFRRCWDAVSLFGVLYYAIVVPFQIAFWSGVENHGVDVETDIALLVIGWIIDSL